MSETTLFTWGYYGWGNATTQLVEAVDAVETSRGFEPPIFVDIRIRRTVRAKGFLGNAFEKLLAPNRHCWMKSLGNTFIESRTGPHIQIADPSAAEALLQLALDSAHTRRRLLFFCSCQWPRFDGEIACHRATVAGLVLEAAMKQGVPVEVVEWPGGEPKQFDLEVTPQVFAAVRKGRITVPLGKQPDLAEFAGLPWCSIVTLHADGHSLRRVVGPAIKQPDQWVLPVLRIRPEITSRNVVSRSAKEGTFAERKATIVSGQVLGGAFDQAAGLAQFESEARRLRRSWGLAPSS